MEQVRHSFSERVLRDMGSAVLVLDKKGGIVFANTPAYRMLELDENCCREGSRFQLLAKSDYNDSFNEAIFRAFCDTQKTVFNKVPYEAPSGKKYVFFMSCSYLQDEGMEDHQLVITLSDETEMEEAKRKLKESSLTFTTFLVGFCVWIIAYALWDFAGRPFRADFMTHGVELLGIVMLLFIIGRTSLTWRDLGITTDEPWKTVRTALIVSACAVAFFCAAKAVGRLINPNLFSPGAPFFDISRFGLRQILYIITAGIQEFLARSVMQGNLRRILVSKHKGVMAIVISSLIFAGLHIHLGFMFMIGAAVLAGLEG
ncbi:MAG: CPBP family intramembrane metalloprotease, partial [Oscillospiraceae bacterium]|nr:CPBP family intramembrane metalloprotease [Oscillospiraceae bacterium]